jgi:phosphoglycerol transferase
LNSAKETSNSKNRLFTAFDFYPTTLTSLGVDVTGSKMGLGVDLFSDKKTLVEEYSLDYLESELHKKSNFYYNSILIGK